MGSLSTLLKSSALRTQLEESTCVEQKERSRVRGGADARHPHVRRQGLPACQRVLRLHRRPEIQHWRPSLPTVHVRPLAGSSWMPPYRRHQAQPDCGGVQEEEGAETWTSISGQLPGQNVIFYH